MLKHTHVDSEQLKPNSIDKLTLKYGAELVQSFCLELITPTNKAELRQHLPKHSIWRVSVGILKELVEKIDHW